MLRNFHLARLYLILLVIFVVGPWLLATGFHVPYERGTAVFSIVSLTLLSSFFYGAFLRRWGHATLARTIAVGLTLGLLGQIAFLLATALSIHLSVDTYFNHPIALNAEHLVRRLGLSEAMTRRLVTLVANTILNGIVGGIGWLLGATLPKTP